MQCEYCGRALKPDEWQCPGCGAPVEHNKKEETKKEKPQESHTNTQSQQVRQTPNYNNYRAQYETKQEDLGAPLHISAYGGFWARCMAAIIDLFIIAIVYTVTGENENIGGIVTILYYIIGESHIFKGGTVGKGIMGLRVVDENFETLTIGKSICRNLAKLLSALVMYFGFFMIMFSNKKQGLHDRICKTFVIKTRR